MAVDHTKLQSHWQLLQNRTANDLFRAFYIIAAQLTQELKKRRTQTSEIQNFLAISSPLVEKKSINPYKSLKHVFEIDPEPSDAELGQKLFETFSKAYQPTICSTRGVMGAMLKGTVNTQDLPVLIATHLLVNHFSEEEEWDEFSSIFAALLNQLGVEEFCSDT